MSSQPEHSPLDETPTYKTEHGPHLLFPVPCQSKRDEIGLAAGTPLPFFGVDLWNLYELSWLSPYGRPQMVLGTVIVSADLPNIVESKSLRLYLNSFNQTRMASHEALQQLTHHDLSEACGTPVQVRIVMQEEFARQKIGELDGLLLDRLDIEADVHQPTPELPHADEEESPVEETLVSHLLRSDCLMTGRPDWDNVQIRYMDAPINQEALLEYLTSFHEHNEFHKQCVKRILTDILRQCHLVKLAVYARYIRRGGLDINPFHTNYSTPWLDNLCNVRQ